MRLLTAFFILTTAFACTDELPNLSGKAVYILSPTNDIILADTLVSFEWEAVLDANRYRLLVSDEDENRVLDTILYSTTFKKRFHRGTYIWQVQAINAVSVAGSELYILTLDPNVSPEENWNEYITLLAPLDSTTYKPDSLGEFIIWWDRIETAFGYQLQIVSPSFLNPQRIVKESNFNGAQTTQTTLSLDSGTYQWRIRAYRTVYVYGEYHEILSHEQQFTPYTKPRTLFIRP